MTHLSPQNIPARLSIPQSLTLIPCGTLEDFPSLLEDTEARSLLAAWTAPWHPVLIAAAGKMPIWARADTIPSTLDDRLVFVPTPSEKKLPSAFESAFTAAKHCLVIRGTRRADLLRDCQAGLSTILESPAGESSASNQPADESIDLVTDLSVATDSRIISADDFFALAYAWLQVQMMTRRLRYTSNLDELYFAGRVVDAATQMVAGNGADTAAALHDAFDALAQERDHYFSNDPHLVDLTLLAPTTLGQSLLGWLDEARLANQPPINFLIDAPLATTIAASADIPAVSLRQAIDDETVGVAGGGLDTANDGESRDCSVHHQTASGIRRAVANAKATTDAALGRRCDVFAQSSGATPGDIGKVIATAGYIGAITTDFASGDGWSTEAKLSWASDPSKLDVMSCKPIDGARSDSFLSLGVRLGQAIDGGEVSTALIVHWPGLISDAYRDLRRAASWGLALGRFWKIDEYFRDGQHPFHHYRGRADEGAANWLDRANTGGTENPLSLAAKRFTAMIQDETAATINTLAQLVQPSNRTKDTQGGSPADAAIELGARMALAPREDPKKPSSTLVINPHSSPVRTDITTDLPPKASAEVFGASRNADGRYDVTVDTPAHGFVVVEPSDTGLTRRWFSRAKRIASSGALENEFMKVELSPTSGGIKGVYSGGGRGNRYAMRLVLVDDTASGESQLAEMKLRTMKVTRADEAVGIIDVAGSLVTGGTQVVAEFAMQYRLVRGSRWLWATATITPTDAAMFDRVTDSWKTYGAFRSAIASEAAAIFSPLRDKMHRCDGKRIDAPMGLFIDEVARQTQFYGDGRPAFRLRGDRFVDSLMMVKNEVGGPHRFAVGFDVPSPIDAVRSLASPPVALACDRPTAPTPSSGWLVHCSTPDVVLCDLQTVTPEPLEISMLVIASRNESRKAKVRFCREIRLATRDGVPLECSGDGVIVPLAGHEIVRLSVQLAVT